MSVDADSDYNPKTIDFKGHKVSFVKSKGNHSSEDSSMYFEGVWFFDSEYCHQVVCFIPEQNKFWVLDENDYDEDDFDEGRWAPDDGPYDTLFEALDKLMLCETIGRLEKSNVAEANA